MKKILLAISIFNILLLAFYFFAHLNNLGIKIAQPPIPGNLPNPGDDPELVAINDYLWFLVVVAVVYAFYKFRALNLQKI
jgi:hypothetical protein